MKNNDNEKDLVEYQQTSLLDFNTKKRDPFSHTIELYDAIPKYVWYTKDRIAGSFLHSIDRNFKHKGESFKVKIIPALVDDKGVDKHFFPGAREELVEDALRKIASDGKGLFLDDYASVIFTLYELREELKRMNHTFSYDKLKESLKILSRTQIVITSENNTEITGSLFENLGINHVNEEGQTRCFVRFNILVNQAIKSKDFRLLHYNKVMGYKKSMSRWLHKRISHNMKQADCRIPFKILLSTIIRDSGLTQSDRIKDSLKTIIRALDELKEVKSIYHYEVEKRTENSKLIDALIIIQLSIDFQKIAIKANQSKNLK